MWVSSTKSSELSYRELELDWILMNCECHTHLDISHAIANIRSSHELVLEWRNRKSIERLHRNHLTQFYNFLGFLLIRDRAKPLPFACCYFVASFCGSISNFFSCFSVLFFHRFFFLSLDFSPHSPLRLGWSDGLNEQRKSSSELFQPTKWRQAMNKIKGEKSSRVCSLTLLLVLSSSSRLYETFFPYFIFFFLLVNRTAPNSTHLSIKLWSAKNVF